MRIISASLADAPLLAKLHAQCFDDNWSKEAFGSLLRNAGAIALIAYGDAETPPAGFILIQIAADEAEILSIGVVSTCRRRGIANALVRAGGKAADERGAATMFLEVDVKNIAARHLYGQLGFEEAGLRRGYYKTCDSLSDALILRTALPIPAWESQFDSISLPSERSGDS